MGMRDNLGGGGLLLGGTFGVDSMMPSTEGSAQQLDVVPGVDGGTSLGLGITFTGLGAASLISGLGDEGKKYGVILIGIGLSLIVFDLFDISQNIITS